MSDSTIVVGSNVHIRRSNGRVHKAIVTKVETLAVVVEWFENNDTKGKEIPIEQILELNPELRSLPSGSNEGSSNSQPVPENASSNNQRAPPAQRRPISRRSELPMRSDRRTMIPARVQQQQQPRERSPSPITEVNRNLPAVAKPKTSRVPVEEPAQTKATTIQPPRKTAMPPKQKRAQMEETVKNICENLKKVNGGSGSGSGGGSARSNSAVRKGPSVMDNSIVVKERRSGGKKANVVDEVEKLRKNREERRAQQNIERERRLEKHDPTNANWEFSDMITEFRAGLDLKPLNECGDVYDQRICVCVRIRPLNRKETNRKEIDVTTVPSHSKIMISEPKSKVDMTKYLDNHTFRFDYAFNDACDNEMVYWYSAKPLVECIFNGGMATCFAYGQTGSGKTHTMGGDFTSGKNQDSTKGIYALASQDVFALLNEPKYKSKNYTLYASFFEIYSGKVFDLLNQKAKLRVLEDGKQQVQVVGLEEKRVSCIDDVLSLIASGTKCRTSGQTSANQHSSRSHAVFQLILRRGDARRAIHGKFSLIDLAGNERGADTTSADRQTRIEGAEINKSLLALKECIRAMSQNSTHIPFRASKLTQVLRDSFIGERSRTCMIATLSPGMMSCEHTLNTLRYADRVKELVADEAGGDEGVKIKMSPSFPTMNNNNVNKSSESLTSPPRLSPKNSDLALIGTLCENEVSQEMIEVHQTMSTLQEMEEETVECHRKVREELKDIVKLSDSLYEKTEGVDFDLESYLESIKTLVSSMNQNAERLKEKMELCQKALVEEETVSRKIKKQRP